MTTRIDKPVLENTNQLLFQVLKLVLADERVAFLCPAGDGEAVIQRLRMQLSRQRQRMRAKGKPIQEFVLCASSHPETHGPNYTRHDCVVMWRVRSKVQQAELEMEQLLGMGGAAA